MRSRLFKYRVIVIASVALVVLLQTPLSGENRSGTSNLAFEGMVKDAQGTPIVGASVSLAQSGSLNPAETADVKTDPTGKFTFPAPKAGTYFLRVQKTGFNEVVQTVTLPFVNQKSCEVVLSPSAHAGKSADGLQFSDDANFTIAGITDWTAAGGHGSDINLRTSESLARDTRILEAPASQETRTATKEQLRSERDELQSKLASNDSADLHRHLADVDEELNDPLAAEREYERATQLDPSEQNYFAWATELLLHRAIQPAQQVFTKGLNAYPHSERMLAGLGAALYASGLYSQAAEQLCAASDLKPDDSTPYLFLGKMVQASAQPLPCAEERLARFSRNQPTNPAANYYNALALWKRAGATHPQAEQTESLLKKAIAADPKFAEAYLQLGILYAAEGKAAETITAYEKAVSANPNFPEAHFRLAQAYKKSGEVDKAQHQFQTYEQLQKSQAAAVEQQRREIQQFVVVLKDKENNPGN